jgi:protein TonB
MSTSAPVALAPVTPLVHERPRVRRKRWVFGLGLSLAAHLALVAALVLRAREQYVTGGEGGEMGVDMVRVEPLEQEPELAAPRAPDTALPARTADAIARPGRRAGTPGRPLRIAAAPIVAAPVADKAPPPTTALAPDPATEAARDAFRATLRKRLHEAWRAAEVYQRLDPRGQLAGSLFTTSVDVRVRPDGRIERASLRDSSGITALDKEAMGALDRLDLPAVPADMVDAQGGWPVMVKFHLDVGMFRYAGEIRRALVETWRPSPAFARTADSERRTVVRYLVNADGTVVSSSVVRPSGLQMLDDNALTAVRPGGKLPAPPRALVPAKGGPATVFVAFLHQAGDIRLMKPREDVEEE